MNDQDPYAKFCAFLGLQDPSAICPISRRILDRFVNHPTNCDVVLGWVKEKSHLFLKKTEDVQHATPDQLQQAYFLTAAGAQLTAEVLGKSVDVESVFTAQDPPKASVLYRKYMYLAPGNPYKSNAIYIGIKWLAEFCDAAIKAGKKGSTSRERNEFRLCIRECIEAGAEEAYHAYQINDPNKMAELLPQLVQKYGPNWVEGRKSEYQRAYELGPDEMERVHKEDPLEIDANRTYPYIQHRVNALVESFQKAQRLGRV